MNKSKTKIKRRRKKMVEVEEVEGVVCETEVCERLSASEIEAKTSSNTLDAFCDPLQLGCNHPLTNHTRGMQLHQKCLNVGCKCVQAKLTERARQRVERGVIA